MTTPRERRAERRSRNGDMVDMNLVSLIDVFTILIFFLLMNVGGVEILASPKSVHLPVSQAEKPPSETVSVIVGGDDVVVDGRRIASVREVLATDGDLVAPLRDALALQASKQVIRSENLAESRRVTVLGDKDIPYRLLRKVMVTAAQSGYADVSFAVQQGAAK